MSPDGRVQTVTPGSLRAQWFRSHQRGSAGVFAAVPSRREEHTDWLETELSLIERVGETNYIAQ